MNVHHRNLDSRWLVPAESLAANAALRPSHVALECGGFSLTYAALDAAAAALAGSLRSAGVHRGDLVAVCLPRSAQQVVALCGAWRAGAAYLPLDPEWPEARLQALLAESGAAVLVAPESTAWRFAGDVPVIDPAAPPRANPLAEPDLPGADDLAYVIYTSGSTGAPKGVEVTQANLAALVSWHVEAFALQPGTRSSHLAGLAFDAAAWEVWPVLASGGTLVLPEDETLRLDPQRLQRWLVDQRVEVCFAPTAIAEPLVGLDWPVGTPLRVLLTGADRLKLRPRAGLPFAFVNNYGPTECTVVATSGTVAPQGEGLPSIGSAIAGTTIHLLDANRQPVAPGSEGEVWIGGAQVARGYRHDPALTAERFVTLPGLGRLYRTGDLACELAGGELEFRGRADGQLKLRGHRIEPAEIEAALSALPGVAQAAVVLAGDELVAHLVAAPGHALEAAPLRAALGERLPQTMLPARYALAHALPLTANGKLDRTALAAAAFEPLPEGNARTAPSTPTEERLAAIIAAVIGRSDFGVDEDFFLLGGHSLLGTQVIVQARDAFGVDLTLFHLFEGRTVAALAARIEDLVFAQLDAMSDEDIRRLAEG